MRFQCNDLAGQGIKRIPDWVWTGGPRPQTNRYTFTTWKFYSLEHAPAGIGPAGAGSPVRSQAIENQVNK